MSRRSRSLFAARRVVPFASFALALCLVVAHAHAAGAPAKPAPDGGLRSSADAGTYRGHGARSVSPETMARFAPRPLAPEISRKVQALLDVRSPAGGVLSPDGKQLYFQWTVTGTRQAWRLDGPGRFPVQLTGGEDATTVVSVAPNGRFVVLQRDRNGEENPGLYLQPIDSKGEGGGPLVELQHRPEVQTFFEFVTADSRAIYFRANDLSPNSFALYRWDVGEKTKTLVFSEPGLWVIADNRGEEQLLLAKLLGSNMAEYYELDLRSRALTPIVGQGEREDYQVRYAATRGEFLVLTSKLDEYKRLYRLRGGKLEPVTAQVPFELEAFSIDEARRRIYLTENRGGYNRLSVLDAHSYKPVPLKLPADVELTELDSVSRDGRYAVLRLDFGNLPSSTYVLDWSRSALTKWAGPALPELESQSFARPTLETYPARDGTPIPMFVRRPKRCAADPCPVIVVFHGGPEAQARPGFSARSQVLVDEGFVVVEPNIRGSSGYGKTWLHADDGPKRAEVITDIEDLSRFVRTAWAKEGKAPKLGVMGGSYGGYATLMAMTYFAGSYDAGVSVVGISNLVTFLENTAPYRRVLRASEYGDLEKDLQALVRLSPTSYVDRVKGPMLIIQGASDPRVPVGEALLIREALQTRGIANSLIIFPDEGHGSAKRQNRVLELGHVLAFFRQHLLESPAVR